MTDWTYIKKTIIKCISEDSWINIGAIVAAVIIEFVLSKWWSLLIYDTLMARIQCHSRFPAIYNRRIDYQIQYPITFHALWNKHTDQPISVSQVSQYSVCSVE